MIQLKLSRTNSIYGSWKCEEFHGLCDPIGIGKDIPEAIEDFLKSCKIIIGVRPNYKWS